MYCVIFHRVHKQLYFRSVIKCYTIYHCFYILSNPKILFNNYLRIDLLKMSLYVRLYYLRIDLLKMSSHVRRIEFHFVTFLLYA